MSRVYVVVREVHVSLELPLDDLNCAEQAHAQCEVHEVGHSKVSDGTECTEDVGGRTCGAREWLSEYHGACDWTTARTEERLESTYVASKSSWGRDACENSAEETVDAMTRPNSSVTTYDANLEQSDKATRVKITCEVWQ